MGIMGGFVQNMGEYGRLWELWEFYGIMGGVGSLPLKLNISAHFGKTRFFPEKRPCTFLALIVVNFHAKYEENPWSGF